MPTQRFSTSVGAGATVENLLDGSVYEKIRAQGNLVIASVGANATDLLMTVLIDAEQVMAESPIPLEIAAGRGPVLPDDVILNEAVRPDDNITIRLRNTNVGALLVRTIVSVP